jgi:CubicO group peptidase (beta-lactamase class C family)
VVFAALGMDGQLIDVAPDRGLVVAVLSKSLLNPLGPPDPGTTADGSDYDALVRVGDAAPFEL